MEEIQEYLKRDNKSSIKGLLENSGLIPVEIQLIRKCQYLTGSEQKEAFEEAKKFFMAFRELGIRCPVVVLFSREEGRIKDGVQDVKRMCELAGEFGINLMFEFMGWAKQINNVKIAWEIIGEANCANGGLLIDTFHFVKGGSKIEDLKQVPMDKIFLVHVNDSKSLPFPIDEQNRRFRFFPGEGEAPLRDIIGCFMEKGYRNFFCIEIFNEDYWTQNPVTILGRAKNTTESLF